MSDSFVSSASKTLGFNDYTVACIGLLYYDWLITIDDEVDFIWKQKWSFGKWLYLLNRYVPMVDLLILSITYSDITLNHKFCMPWWHVDTWLAVFNFIIIDIVLLLRTWALWKRKRWVLNLLVVSLILCGGATAVAAMWGSLHVVAEPSPNNIHPCNSEIRQVIVMNGVWAGLMVYDFTVLVLMLIKAVPILWAMPLSPTLRTLFQDGFLYYIVIFFASVSNIIMITVAPPEFATMLFTLHRVMTSLLGSRLILNLRGTIMRPSGLADLETTRMEMFSAPSAGSRNKRNEIELTDFERGGDDFYSQMDRNDSRAKF